VVEGGGQVEVVEEVGVLGHAIGVVLGHEFELLHELGSVHHLHLLLELTDHVLELVVDQNHTVAVLRVLDGLVGDGSS
jgi:hypothetical protein